MAAQISSSPAAEASQSASTDHGATGDRPGPKPSTSKKTASSKPRKAKSAVAQHPKYSMMIADAIAKLKERGGSSRQAILKYIAAHYKVGSEVNRINARVKASLRAGVKSGALKQSKGTGAAGSFRLGDYGKKRNSEKPKSKISKVKKASPGKSTAKKAKTAVRKPKSTKSSAKKSSGKAKLKSPAKKLKAAAKKVKTSASKLKTKTKSPAEKLVKHKAKKQTKKAHKK